MRRAELKEPYATRFQLWVDDLKAHPELKGKFHLAYMLNGKMRYCCLGRLCEVALTDGLPVRRSGSLIVDYDGMTALPPISVLKWVGLDGDLMFDPDLPKDLWDKVSEIIGSASTLTSLNDRTEDWDMVIAVLEARPRSLFLDEACVN